MPKKSKKITKTTFPNNPTIKCQFKKNQQTKKCKSEKSYKKPFSEFLHYTFVCVQNKFRKEQKIKRRHSEKRQQK